MTQVITPSKLGRKTWVWLDMEVLPAAPAALANQPWPKRLDLSEPPAHDLERGREDLHRRLVRRLHAALRAA